MIHDGKKSSTIALGVLVIVCYIVTFREWTKQDRAEELCWTIVQGDEDRMRELLNDGVSPDWKTSRGLSARELAKKEDCDWCEKVFQDFAPPSKRQSSPH